MLTKEGILSHAGEFAALLTAVFWTITALAFESASRKIGSMVVNLLRLLVGFVFLSAFNWLYRGYLFPADATPENWFYLIISGLIGFVFGDLCLFQAFVVIGARISMLLMALAPPMTALIGWIILGEKMTLISWTGMIITLSGIALVVLKRQDPAEEEQGMRKIRFSYPIWGILLGLGGALGQAAGLVLSKYGMSTGGREYSPFAASQIRVMAGIVGFTILLSFMKQWKNVRRGLHNGKAVGHLSIGAFFGPFLGVSFSLISVQLTSAGIAATIMAMVPVLIIPPSVIFLKEKVNVKEVIGAILAVSGVALFFI
ncbi:MAG: DMT family transporter [Syntrophothermus sp.]